MSHRRIGQLLSTLVPMTDQDVEEILQEQDLSHRQFGEIAIAWGLCTPAHVWEAWARQPHETLLHVDLDQLGVDSQAAAFLAREHAKQFGAVPIRAFETLLVFAVKNVDACVALEQLFGGKHRIAFVIADADKIDEAISTYYCPAPEAA
jgi:hypothetical protein